MDIHLIVHNALFIVSAVASLGLSLFLVINKPRSASAITLALTSMAVTVFIFSHVIGVNISDPNISRDVLMFNLANFFIGMFNVHFILAYLGKDRERWYMLAFVYLSGLFAVIWFLAYPDLFLLPSVPKMYFPDYYNPGALNWVRLAYLDVVCLFYILAELYSSYRHAASAAQKQSLKYLILGFMAAYALGFFPNFLVYNIPIDPLWGGIFLVLFCLPFFYGVIKYDLLGIRIVAKQAFIYAVGIGAVGGLAALLDYFNRVIRVGYPGFPAWLIPLAVGAIVVSFSSIVWRRLREDDVMKYEFVTTATHKFRTPLTQIKWAAENLSKSKLSTEDRQQVEYIRAADQKLVELTGLLMNVSAETKNDSGQYQTEVADLSIIAGEMTTNVSAQYADKNPAVKRHLEPGLYTAVNQGRVRFVMQTLLENAMRYTPAGGRIDVYTRRKGKSVIFSVKDSGIGIAKDELSRLFSKFYRSKEARLSDTEGMGIGLSISKNIINGYGGKIWAESEGVGHGSVFSFFIPAI